MSGQFADHFRDRLTVVRYDDDAMQDDGIFVRTSIPRDGEDALRAQRRAQVLPRAGMGVPAARVPLREALVGFGRRANATEDALVRGVEDTDVDGHFPRGRANECACLAVHRFMYKFRHP